MGGNCDSQKDGWICRCFTLGAEMKIRNLNVPFTEAEYRMLEKKKGKMTWHDFILGMTEIIQSK